MLLEGKTWACGLFSPKPTQLQQQTGVGEWVWLGGEGEREMEQVLPSPLQGPALITVCRNPGWMGGNLCMVLKDVLKSLPSSAKRHLSARGPHLQTRCTEPLGGCLRSLAGTKKDSRRIRVLLSPCRGH